jgi:hypothetical protein
MNYLVRLNVGSEKVPEYLYYVGYRTYPDKEQNLPAGPILTTKKSDAWKFPALGMASNIVNADERLKGAKVVPDEQ